MSSMAGSAGDLYRPRFAARDYRTARPRRCRRDCADVRLRHSESDQASRERGANRAILRPTTPRLSHTSMPEATHCRAGRRLLLVPRSRVRRARGRAVGRIRLRRREAPNPSYEDVCSGAPGMRRSCGSASIPAAVVRRSAARLLLDSRSDDARPPGQRRRHAVPVGDLLARRRSSATRRGGRSPRSRPRGFGAARSSPRSAGRGALLRGRALSPGILREQSAAALLPGRRRRPRSPNSASSTSRG